MVGTITVVDWYGNEMTLIYKHVYEDNDGMMKIKMVMMMKMVMIMTMKVAGSCHC